MTKTQLKKRINSIMADLAGPANDLAELSQDIEAHMDTMSERWRDGDVGCVWQSLAEECQTLSGDLEGGLCSADDI